MTTCFFYPYYLLLSSFYSSFYHLQTHSCIVIGAFPKAGLIVYEVGACVFVASPEPFALFVVYDMLTRVVPTAARDVESSSVAEVLVKVYVPNNALAHHPPLALGVHFSRVCLSFVHHRTIRLQPLVGRFGNGLDGFFNLCQHGRLPQLQRSLV